MHPLAQCLVAVCAYAFTSFAQAQAWPAKSIRLVVNAGPGGATDVIARSMTTIRNVTAGLIAIFAATA